MAIYHLYTAAGLILGCTLIFRLFRCAHGWELVDKTEFKSEWDQLPVGSAYNRCDIPRLMRKKVVLVMRCNKCGAAKVYEIYSN
jgi:hypothetical protein